MTDQTNDPPDTCPGCGRLVDEHLVAELRACLSPFDPNVPFEEVPYSEVEMEVVTATSVTVTASLYSEPTGGIRPVLIFGFAASDGPFPPMALVLDDTAMRSVRQLVGQAVDAALVAARRRRGRG